MSEQRPFPAGEPDRSVEDSRIDAAIGEKAGPDDLFAPASEEERAAAAIHAAVAGGASMPDAVRQRLAAALAARSAQGPASSASSRLVSHAGQATRVPSMQKRRKPMMLRVVPWLAAAAAIAFAIFTGYNGSRAIKEKEAAYAALQTRFEEMQARATSNESVLAAARSRAEQLEQELRSTQATVGERDTRLVDAAKREVELAERLAAATAQLDQSGSRLASTEKELDDARLTLARLQAPIDPAELQQNRTRLIDVPDSVQIAWAPFNLPDSPAEQPDVQGDVVWNDRLQTGYLRFVGLNPNDPNIEQYQVWVIDERGLEQKVSGGVFNASAEGEVIVPIEPGIAVGRVALFAITVENPGGTWVPDLKRRVVVAPRAE